MVQLTEAFCSAFLRGPVDQDRVVTTGESCVGVEDGTRWMDGWMDVEILSSGAQNGVSTYPATPSLHDAGRLTLLN